MTELNPLSKKEREKVEMYFSVTNLISTDFASKSDPYLLLYLKSGNNWLPLGRTEIQWNQSNADFVKTFEVDFVFERRQLMRVECRDADDEHGEKYTPLGQVILR